MEKKGIPDQHSSTLDEKLKKEEPRHANINKCVSFINFLYYLNIRSVNNKNNLIEVELNDSNTYFIALVETWAKEDEVCSISINEYNFISHYSRKILRGGGCAIWARKDLIVEPVNVIKHCIEQDFEVCGVKWSFNQKLHILICIYRAPTGNFQTFGTGEFNINFNIPSFEANEILNIMAQFGLHEVVFENTRVTSTTSTRIDNVFINVDNEVVTSIDDTPISDHKSITVKVNSEIELHTYTSDNTLKMQKRNFNSTNKELFANTLKVENWSEVYDLHDCSDKFNQFFMKFWEIFDVCFPLSNRIGKTNKKSWVSSVIKTSSENLRDLFILQKQYEELKDHYKIKKAEHMQLVETTKKNIL
ncbi:hypothetical protein JTB14_029928 [Gonioctena quinquepunctata]|nr:hypothetical protein JTB14_029928 [Gonioctena quinquepunctata]